MDGLFVHCAFILSLNKHKHYKKKNNSHETHSSMEPDRTGPRVPADTRGSDAGSEARAEATRAAAAGAGAARAVHRFGDGTT